MNAMDQGIPPTSASPGWRREGFELALIGPEAMRHKELLRRAGYGVRGASSGDRAQLVFADEKAVDLIVLDFALEGRPPEAVLLFSRGTSASAALVALVPSHDAEGFRRAFLAGARDVLPTPSRGEDLLASVDYLLEPRALEATVQRLRAQLGGDETLALPSAPTPEERAALIALEAQVKELRREIERLHEQHEGELTSLRARLEEAAAERDRATVSRKQARARARSSEQAAKDGQAQVRLLERACEELQLKLKDARVERRSLETRLANAEKRVRTLEEVIHQHVEAAELEVQGAVGLSAPSDLDPEAALDARALDARRLAELELAMQERDSLERRVAELEQELERVSERAAERAAERGEGAFDTPSQLEGALSLRDEDERRLAELDDVLRERERLDEEVRRLNRALAEPAADPRSAALAAELRDLKEAYAESLAMLEAVRADRGSAGRRLLELEREAADAVMRVEELTPLVGEVERLRVELRAERQARKAALRSVGDVTTQFSRLDQETATLLEELEAKQRALVLAHARQEALSVELANLRAQLAVESGARDTLMERLRDAERELERVKGSLPRVPDPVLS